MTDCDGASELEAVYTEVAGLTGEERRQRLVELAQEEGGTLSYYTTTPLDESGPISEAFENVTGISVELYRADDRAVLQRILQEAQANHQGGADVVSVPGPTMAILDREGHLLPLESPATQDLISIGVFDNWATTYLLTYVAAWNENEISPEQAPASWEDVLTEYAGDLAMEGGDWEWFATLVEEHFVGGEGMSEDEAIELFREGARGARVVEGHTLMVELTAGGEFSIAASVYQDATQGLIEEGAPQAWQPAVEPLVVKLTGIGIACDVSHPAAALLYTEYELTDGQELLAELGNTVANTTQGSGIPEDWEVLSVDLEMSDEERVEWENLYQEVIREAGGTVTG